MVFLVLTADGRKTVDLKFVEGRSALLLASFEEAVKKDSGGEEEARLAVISK